MPDDVIRFQPARDRAPGAPRTAFVLSGGASLGAVQAGMLRALYERGITPDMLVATSAGGLNAAFVASRPQTVETAKELADVWVSLRREDVFPVHMPTIFGALTKRGDHFVPCRPLRRVAATHLRIARLEDAAVPLHLVAFDLLGGSEVRLSRGPAIDAVLATAAVPGVLPPVSWGDRLLVDGGVVNNTPISHAIELGAERVFVLLTSDPDERGLAVRPRRPLDAAVQACKVLVGARLKADLVRYAAEAELIVLRAPNRARVQPNDFDQAELLIADGLRVARRQLDGLDRRAAIAA
jgi:NTE family protein